MEETKNNIETKKAFCERCEKDVDEVYMCERCEMMICDKCTASYNQFSQIDYTCCKGCGSPEREY
jgi:Pyruvate/2-oxoacid:ferredoxin oxidoreductase delta subunit